MDSIVVTAADRKRYARARAAWLEAEAAPAALVRARYDARRDAVDLTFRCGVTMAIPRALIPEFDDASTQDLRAIKAMTYEAIECEPLDTHHYVPGLVESVMGARFFAAATGRRGGQRRSKIKAAAARANGALGGRPRKRKTT
jgi:hypothetical protein